MLDIVLADLRANVDAQRLQGVRFWAKVLGKALVTPQVQVVVLFRIGSALAHTPLRPFAFVLRALSVALGGAEIHPDARLGPGFVLIHSSGVVIGAGVRIGKDCRVAQGVTLGEPGRGTPVDAIGFPVLGDHVTLGANATVLGPRRIGSGAVVGANSVVVDDVASLTLVAGSPARVIRTLTPGEIVPGAESL